MFIFDAHLDLAMNAMEWNRDLTWSVANIRESEQGMTDRPDRGRNTVSFDAMRAGNIGLCVATQIARYVKKGNPLPGWRSPQQAWAQTQGQLAWYRSMEEAGELVQIRTKAQLEDHLKLWNSEAGKKPIGYILSLEGADSIVSMNHLEQSFEAGLRAIGPAHYGPGTYAFGTDSSGSIGRKGRALLTEMGRLGLILDATHLCDQSFWEALDHYKGPVWASHNNCRALVDHNRQFSDEQIKTLIDRGAVIGMAMDAWMMVPRWIRGQSTPQGMGLFLGTDPGQHRPYLPIGRKRRPCRNRYRPGRRLWHGTVPFRHRHHCRPSKNSRAFKGPGLFAGRYRKDYEFKLFKFSKKNLEILVF